MEKVKLMLKQVCLALRLDLLKLKPVTTCLIVEEVDICGHFCMWISIPPLYSTLLISQTIAFFDIAFVIRTKLHPVR